MTQKQQDPQDKTQDMCARVGPPVAEEFRQHCQERGLKISATVTRVLGLYLQNPNRFEV